MLRLRRSIYPSSWYNSLPIVEMNFLERAGSNTLELLLIMLCLHKLNITPGGPEGGMKGGGHSEDFYS